MSFLMLILLLGLLLTAIGMGVWGLLKLRRAGDPSVGGRCGKCGYAVRGLTTFTCPECGADLRQAGIINASGNKVAAIVMLVFSGVVLLGMCGCLGFAFMGTVRQVPPSTQHLVMPNPPTPSPNAPPIPMPPTVQPMQPVPHGAQPDPTSREAEVEVEGGR